MSVGQKKADAQFQCLKERRHMGRDAPLGVHIFRNSVFQKICFYSAKSGIKNMKLLQSSERLFHMSSENCAKGKRLLQELYIMQALAHGDLLLKNAQQEVQKKFRPEIQLESQKSLLSKYCRWFAWLNPNHPAVPVEDAGRPLTTISENHSWSQVLPWKQPFTGGPLLLKGLSCTTAVTVCVCVSVFCMCRRWGGLAPRTKRQ